MKVSSIIVGALAAVVSATPIPGKEISKRGAFGTGNVLGSLTGAFDFNLVNNFAFNDPLLAHLALINGFNANIFQGFAVNNNLAFDGFAQTLLLQSGGIGNLGLGSLLDIHTFALLGWLDTNGLINNGFNVGGLQLPNALSFGLIDQFGLNDFVFNLAIDEALNQQILASLSNSLLFAGGIGGGFGGGAVVSSVQSTVIVKE